MICSFILLKSEIFLISSLNLVQKCEVGKNETKQKKYRNFDIGRSFYS